MTGGTDATGGGASNLALDTPVKIILLAETKGDSEVAVPFLADGAQLAVDDLNAKGGVGGKNIDYERIVTPLDSAKAESARLEAIGKKPTAMLGLVSSGQVLAVARVSPTPRSRRSTSRPPRRRSSARRSRSRTPTAS